MRQIEVTATLKTTFGAARLATCTQIHQQWAGLKRGVKVSVKICEFEKKNHFKLFLSLGAFKFW